jgi:hypothetical protein
LIDISLDEALSYIGKIGDIEFIREVQRMLFKVSLESNTAAGGFHQTQVTG